MTEQPDIAIVGGGPAGMIAALTLARTGRSVALVDPAPPGAAQEDLRSTALLAPSLSLLESAGVLGALSPHGAALKIMRLAEVDEAGVVTATHNFAAEEAGLEMFGLNFPNTALKSVLAQAVEAHPGITRHIARARSVLDRDRTAILWLEDGTRLSPALVVAADGRDSALREAAGIAAHTLRYGQKATVFAVSHAQPHGCVSTELHRQGGPFTLVPLPGEDQSRSAVVWMDDGPEVQRRAGLEDDAFIAEAQERSGGILGPLELISQRAVWPIISRRAERLVAPRMALIAEAAHVVPPIGAQGLNMSLKDIATLADLTTKTTSREEIGGPTFLAAYERARLIDTQLHVAGIDALNRTSQAGRKEFRSIRAAGMKLLAETGALRRAAISAGLGLQPATAS